MSPSDLAAALFVRRLLESTKDRAGKLGDQNLRDFAAEVIRSIDHKTAQERIRRGKDLSKLGGLVIKLTPACTDAALRSMLGTALVSCQCLIPQMPSWLREEVLRVEDYVQKSVRYFESGAEPD